MLYIRFLRLSTIGGTISSLYRFGMTDSLFSIRMRSADND